MIDFNELLREISWKTKTGIIDLKNEEHLKLLRNAMIEKDINRNVIHGIIYNLKNKTD